MKKTIFISIYILLTLSLFSQKNQSFSKFNYADIGFATKFGSVKIDKDEIEIKAGGKDIWGKYDEFAFEHKQLKGDFDFSVQVVNLSTTHGYTKAGIMARANLSDSSQHVLFQVFPDNRPRNKNNGGCEFQYRAETGGDMKAIYPDLKTAGNKFDVTFPNTWIRLKRTGNIFISYISSDNKIWHHYSSFTLKMPAKLYIGLAVTAHHSDKYTKAQFKAVQIIKPKFKSNPAFVCADYTQGKKISESNDYSLLQNLSPITFTNSCYIKDGKPFYVRCGEMHYFRVPKADWKSRMELLKQAGGNCIATLVPWILHEPKEGTFDFDSVGIYDLEGFLKLAKEQNLFVMIRPGPYQYSELAYDGLPVWLSKNYPALRAKKFDGTDMQGSVASYQHPLFLKKVKTWFDKVNPILAKYSVNKGGPIIMYQLDNELTGVQIWNGSTDYNPETMGFGQKGGKYTLFLENKYGNIASLNKSYGTKHTSFEAVLPIETKAYDTSGQMLQVKDYYDFYYKMCAEYLDTLATMAHNNGIDVPFVHNAANPEMIPYFKESVVKLKLPFLLGMDIYYNLDQKWDQNNPTPQYAIRNFFGLEMLRLMGFPQTVFELPSGSASDWPAISNTDAKACYMLNVAFGMKGYNHYIFTGGPNPLGYGLTADIYDYGAPVGAKGEIRPLYYAQKEVADFIVKENWLADAKLVHDCRISLDFEYARSGNYWKNKGNLAVSSPEAWNLTIEGVLTTAMLAGISPEFCDLSTTDFMKEQTPLIVVSSSAMSADKQHNIVSFLKQGGKVLLLPTVPEFDNNLNPCTILKDFIGNIKFESSTSTVKRATFGTIQNVRKNNIFVFDKMPNDAEVLGLEEHSGKPIACKFKTEGNGTMIVAGINWLASHKEQNQMLMYLLSKLDYKQQVTCDNMNVWHTLRTDGNHQMLFLMNLYTSPQSANIEYLDKSGKMVKLGKVDIEAMSVKPILLK